jgi:hypothetical protein
MVVQQNIAIEQYPVTFTENLTQRVLNVIREGLAATGPQKNIADTGMRMIVWKI